MKKAGFILVFFWIFIALFAGWLSPDDPYKQTPVKAYSEPSYPNIFGRDDLGRDMLSRIFHGSRISLTIGIASEGIALVIGLLIGVLSGFFRGRTDELLMGFTDIILSMPAPLLALAIMAIFERSGMWMIILLLGFFGWPTIARLSRAETMRVMENDYIYSEKSLGATRRRILFKTVLPNIMAPIWVAATVGIAFNILSEAWLSFVGVGVPPPQPSWGWMINEGKDYLGTYPWLSIAPGLAIFTTVLGFCLIGDYLRDHFDIKTG